MWLALLLLATADLTSNKDLLARARGGDRNAQIEAVLLHRKGALPELPSQQASLWFRQSLSAKHPAACLEQAKTLIDTKKNPETLLRCGAAGKLPEAQYLLGRLILNLTAAEDEQQRFEGLAYLALAAKAGYPPAVRRWDLVAPELSSEDLGRVEQKSNEFAAVK